jgi:hypothetical protein
MHQDSARLWVAGRTFLSELEFHVRVGLRCPSGLARCVQRFGAAIEDFWCAWDLDSGLISPAEAQEALGLTEAFCNISRRVIRSLFSAEHLGRDAARLVPPTAA